MKRHAWIAVLAFVTLLVSLLWFAFQYWLPHLMTVLDRKEELRQAGTFGDSYGALNTLFSGLAFSGIVVSVFLQSHELADTRRELESQKEELRKSHIHQVLVSILGEYRSLEMLAAVRGLWDFRKNNSSNLANAYTIQFNAESELVSKLPLAEQLDAERVTIHNKRRLVSQFYQHLAGLYELGIIDGKILYSYWSESDLAIIPRVLIPMEIALGSALGVDIDHSSPVLTRMQRLYDDSRRCVPDCDAELAQRLDSKEAVRLSNRANVIAAASLIIAIVALVL